MFSEEQIADILAALPDPAFILTRSGCYAAIFGGSDLRYYHDGSGLIGKSLHDVLHTEKATWFAKEIEKALSSQQLHIVEYELAGSDVKGLEDGPSNVIWFEGRVQALNFQVLGEDAVLWVASNMVKPSEIKEVWRHNAFHRFLMIFTAVTVPIFGFLEAVLAALILFAVGFKFFDKRATPQNAVA